ncbi:ADAMTS-like protein 5 isoform X1 [Microcaecilia unicolor]|uniref:ADAMTS-like protein 5 isoform X1 n=1 Tax=Microcaecilia unicolor TaxID=1415580 RepID=A0A6P7X4K7_9AMPH|nr:ADAMTS-like protein 5 isoform X1 [Microcaecilia unicolor]
MLSYRLTSVRLAVVYFLWALQGGPSFCQGQRHQQSVSFGFNNGWSPWRSWSPCSQTCGGGVSVRTRQCLSSREDAGELCQGSPRQYRVCSTQDCPPGSTDFRHLQCAAYNNKNVLGNYQYQWVPFQTGHSECDLTCLAKGQNFYYNFGRVLDGTKCHTDSDGVCISGHCLQVGCDLLLGSREKTDICGVCGGKNASCRHHHSVYTTERPPSGLFEYNEVTMIPAGATHIKVTDNSKNYLALRNGNFHYVINGDWSINWPGVYSVAGTKVLYRRSADNQESFEATGPTEENLYVMVLFTEQNSGIEYEYWLPNDHYNDHYRNRSPLLPKHPEATTSSHEVSTTQPAPRTSKVVLWKPAVPINPHPQPRLQRENAETNDILEDPRLGKCGKCKKVQGRQNKIKQYCEKDFVFRGKVISKKTVGHETRYEVQVILTYKNNFPIVRREYVWVPNLCDCPNLLEKREYVLMAQRHVNFEHTLNRILLDSASFVRPYRPKEEKLLRGLDKECAKHRYQVRKKFQT